MEQELRSIRLLLIHIGAIVAVMAIAVVRSVYPDDSWDQVGMMLLVAFLAGNILLNLVGTFVKR